jgi:hypothetical protein
MGACKFGHLPVVQWLYNDDVLEIDDDWLHKNPMYRGEKVNEFAHTIGECGDISVIQWLSTKLKATMKAKAHSWTTMFSPYHMLMDILSGAAKTGRLDVLKIMYDVWCDTNLDDLGDIIIELAVEYKHIPILHWIMSTMNDSFTVDYFRFNLGQVFITALNCQSSLIVRWVRSIDPNIWDILSYNNIDDDAYTESNYLLHARKCLKHHLDELPFYVDMMKMQWESNQPYNSDQPQ